MRFLGLACTLVLLSSSIVLAQHSSGGGGCSGGSSNSSGGGSHSSSSGGSGSSANSGGSHSVGGSSSHVSNGHGTNAPAPSRSNGFKTARAAPSLRSPVRTTPAEKRGFFSFLRHPFHRTPPKTVADLRRPVCFRGPCLVCPPGAVNASSGCGMAFNVHRNDLCSSREIWSGGACLEQTQFLNDCSSLRTAMQQEEQRLRAAQFAQQSACSAGSAQDCSASTNASRNEENLYRSLQLRYRRCQRQFVVTGFPFAPNAFADRLAFSFDYAQF